MRIFLIALLAVLLLPVAMADVGPHPPWWISITLNITRNGAPVPDDTKVEAFCYRNGNQSDIYKTNFTCFNGTCGNFGNAYGLFDCYNNNIYFNISHSSFGRTYTTPGARIGGGGSQPNFDIELKPNGTATITEKQEPAPSPCATGALLAALPLALLAARRR